MGTAYTAITGLGAIPNIKTRAFLAWKDKLIAYRIKESSGTRTSNLYFASAGNDTTGDGSIGNPYQTLAKAQVEITIAASGDLACWFNRGDEWNETTGLSLAADGLTIGAYGTGNKPWFNRFTVKYNSSGWILASGNRYTRVEANTIGSVRHQGYVDSKRTDTGYLLSRQTTEADCLATSYSWCYVAGNLSVNLGGTDPNTLNLEAVIDNTSTGIDITGDGCLVEGIRCDGWSCSPSNPHTPQAYQFRSRLTGTDACVIKDCEGYYGGTHLIAHYVGAGSGGIFTAVDCVAGFTTSNAAGETLFNTYAQTGGQETYFVNCSTIAGTLPNGTSAWAGRGIGFYGHTSGGANVCSLIIADRCRTVKSPAQITRLGYFENCPDSYSDITACRAIFIDKFVAGDFWAATPYKNNAWINPFLYLTPSNLTSQALFASGNSTQYFAGYVINGIIAVDLTNQSSTTSRALFNSFSAPDLNNKPRFYHTAIIIKATDNSWLINFDTSSVDNSPEGECKNCLFVGHGITGGATVSVGVNNDATYQLNNAYYGMTGGSDIGTRTAYGLCVDKVELPTDTPIPITAPVISYNLLALTKRGVALGVEYDQGGRPRPTIPTIGPIEMKRVGGLRENMRPWRGRV